MPRAILKFLIPVVLLALVPLMLVSGCGTQADQTLSPTKIGEYNKPGTVLVETVWTANVTVPELTLDEQALVNYLLGLVAQGTITDATTDEEIATLAIAELVKNPQLYLVAAPSNRVKQMETTGYGSGIIVTDDGYIVTNAHVVKSSGTELQQAMAEEAAAEYLTEDLNAFEEALGIDLNQEYENRFLAAAASIYQDEMTVSDPEAKSSVYLISVGDESVSEAMPVEVVEVGEPIDIENGTGKDVAILKASGHDLPTVPMGDDSAVMGGEQAVALGYPGASLFNPAFDLTKDATPTLTQGTISGRKTMKDGWEVIQTDTAIAHGSSGGPLFNEKGEFIAINTFGGFEYNEQTGEYEIKEGFGFAVPTTVINEFTERANVHPEMGQLTKTYREGIDLFLDNHYSAAKEKFEAVRDANSDFPYIKDYIEQCTAKINAGEDVSTTPTWVAVLVLVVIIAIVVGVILLIVMLVRRSKRSRPVPPPVGGPGMPPPPGTTPPGPTPPGPTPPGPTPPPAGTATGTPASQPPTPGTPPAPGTGEPAAAPPTPPPTEKAAPTAEPEAPAAPPAAEPPAGPPPAAGTEAPSTPPSEEPAAPEGDKEAEEEHNFCSKCGARLSEGAEFCSKCGTPVKK